MQVEWYGQSAFRFSTRAAPQGCVHSASEPDTR